MVCYFNEVLNKIVSTSGNRGMTCHETLVTLSNTPEPTDLPDTAQGPSLISSDFGQMGWLEAPYRGVAEGLVRLSPHLNIDQSMQGPRDGCRGSLASTVPRGSPPLQRAEGARVSTGCSWVSAASREQRCKSLSPHEEVALQWEGGASALPFAQQSRADEVRGDVAQPVPDVLQPSAWQQSRAHLFLSAAWVFEASAAGGLTACCEDLKHPRVCSGGLQ